MTEQVTVTAAPPNGGQPVTWREDVEAWVCAVPDEDGPCGYPVETMPCPVHAPEDDDGDETAGSVV